MNSPSTNGIFVFLLFAYCTPTQGQSIALSEVIFENGQHFRSTSLTKSSDGAYTIGTRQFGVKGIDTIIGKDVVLCTDDNSYIQMELANSRDSQQLFNMTTQRRISVSIAWYYVSAIYEFNAGKILEDVSISMFVYATGKKLQHRYVVRTAESTPGESGVEPLLFWTEKEFNYSAYKNTIILTLRPKPKNPTYYKYYLVKFRDETTRENWSANQGHSRYTLREIPAKSAEAFEYFRQFL